MPARPTWPVGELAFAVPGNARPLARPRFTGSGGGHVYNPSGPDIAEWRRSAHPHAPGAEPPPGPVAVELEFVFGRPAGHRRRDGTAKDSAAVDHVSKPDVDNLAKLALDAMTGTFFADDSQVVALRASKRWADVHEAPATLVRVRYGTLGRVVEWPVSPADPGATGEK